MCEKKIKARKIEVAADQNSYEIAHFKRISKEIETRVASKRDKSLTCKDEKV